MAALDDLLVLVAGEDRVRAQAPVGEAGGERVDAVGPGGLADRLLVSLPGDRGAALAGAGGDDEQVGERADEDLRDAPIDLRAGLVVATAEPVADPVELLLGARERPLAGRLDLALLLVEWM